MKPSPTNADEMTALRKRFPRPAPATAAFQALSIVLMNAYLLHLVIRHASSPVAIALYSVIELIALSIITNVALAGVPKELRVGSPDMPVWKRVLAIAVISMFLCFIFWLSVSGDKEHIDQLRHAANPVAVLRGLNILWPLLTMTGLAVFGSISDRLRWRASGGPYVTGAAMSAAPKFMTAIVGPIAAGMLSGGLGGENPERAAVTWCIVFLAIKSALELLVLAWHFRGMPEGQEKVARESPNQ
jgi:hypothetical protein